MIIATSMGVTCFQRLIHLWHERPVHRAACRIGVPYEPKIVELTTGLFTIKVLYNETCNDRVFFPFFFRLLT